MDISRSIKRLALIVILAIFVILLSKSLLSKAVRNLSLEVEKKQQAQAMKKTSATLPESAPAREISSSPASPGSLEAVIQSSPGAIENPASTQ